MISIVLKNVLVVAQVRSHDLPERGMVVGGQIVPRAELVRVLSCFSFGAKTFTNNYFEAPNYHEKFKHNQSNN